MIGTARGEKHSVISPSTRLGLPKVEVRAATNWSFGLVPRKAGGFTYDQPLQNLLRERRYQCYHWCMAQLLVRELEEEVVQALRLRAAAEGTSVEEAHRRLLRSVLLSKKPRKTFKEALLEIPDDGEDSIFERVRRKPRKVVL